MNAVVTHTQLCKHTQNNNICGCITCNAPKQTSRKIKNKNKIKKKQPVKHVLYIFCFIFVYFLFNWFHLSYIICIFSLNKNLFVFGAYLLYISLWIKHKIQKVFLFVLLDILFLSNRICLQLYFFHHRSKIHLPQKKQTEKEEILMKL